MIEHNNRAIANKFAEYITGKELRKYVADKVKKYVGDNPSVFDGACGYYVIIMTVVKSLIKSRVLVLLQNIKTLKNNNLCVV